tara:strand:+ start:166 stop:327 length:162 start_codon:yes stop_codon:yes gene_type:complete
MDFVKQVFITCEQAWEWDSEANCLSLSVGITINIPNMGYMVVPNHGRKYMVLS